MVLELTRLKFTVDDYYRMADAGILREGQRVELIDGEILEMSPIGERHVWCVIILTNVLKDTLGRRVLVSVQNPLVVDELSEPQPDVIVLPRPVGRHPSEKPTAGDVLLIVEVADSSLDYDIRVKGPLYARLGIPEYWIASLPEDLVRVHRDPAPDGYRTILTLSPGERISPLAFPGESFLVDEILGELGQELQ